MENTKSREEDSPYISVANSTTEAKELYVRKEHYLRPSRKLDSILHSSVLKSRGKGVTTIERFDSYKQGILEKEAYQ